MHRDLAEGICIYYSLKDYKLTVGYYPAVLVTNISRYKPG